MAQGSRIPIEKRGGHLFSQWTLNNSVKANVFLESGFPKIIFSQSFIELHKDALKVKLEVPSEDIFVGFWGADKKYKALYTINDSLTINGVKLSIDALVVDTSEIPSWGERDILFPILDLQKRIELNISSKYIRMLDAEEKISEEYISFNVHKDDYTRALYLTTTLTAYDDGGSKEELTGNFQLDLGAGNAFTVNKSQPNVAEFVALSDRMVLKDSTQVQGPKDVDLSIIMPYKVRLGNIEVNDSYIVSMKYKGKGAALYSGNIGPKFFESFIVIFDFENSKFYLKPTSYKVKIVK